MKIIKQWFLKFKIFIRYCSSVARTSHFVRSINHDFVYLLFLLIVTVCASLALLQSGYIPTHDGEYHIIRFWQFYKMLSLGNWFPRWAPDLNNGYGIPIFNYVYPLPNYISAIFHFMGFSLTDSLKMVLFTGFILSGFSFYVLLRFFFKPLPSLVGSIFYLLAPYHLVDVYIRGSVGEVWALFIAPLVLWSGLSKKYLIFSFSLALLIFSHNILALMFFIFIILFLFFHNLSLRAPSEVEGRGNLFSWIEIASSFRQLAELLAMTLVGLGLSAIFWLPAIVEEKYVVGLKQVSFSDHFPQIWQLIFPSWGTGFSGTGDLANQMSFQIGIPHLLIIAITSFWLVQNLLRRFRSHPPAGGIPRMTKLVVFLLIILALTIFLILEFSLPLWKIIPFLSFFQYPWRFLSLVIFITSILSAWVVHLTEKRWLAILLLSSALLFYYPYTKPVVYQERQDSYYLNNPTWTLGTDSPGNSFNTIWFKSNNVLAVKPLNRYELTVEKNTQMSVNITYFPGWQVYVDQTLQKIYPNREGLISFSLAKGQHVIEIKFADTPIRTWAKYVSIISFVFLFLTLIPSPVRRGKGEV